VAVSDETPLWSAETESPIQSRVDTSLANAIVLLVEYLKPQGSYNAQFWAQATEVENLMRVRAEVGRKISLREFSGPEAVWQTTEEAKNLFQQIKAHQVKSQICNQRSEQLTEKGDRSMRASFIKLFTTSKMGLGIKDTGAGKRDGKLQTDFRKEMIKVYGSQHESEDLLWCPIVGKWTNPKDMKAAHLFAYVHGQDTMDAIFGETKTPELFSPKNGILISSWIVDSGKLVLVPDIPSTRPNLCDIRAWVNQEVRQYKIRIIDTAWNKFKKPIHSRASIRWCDLHDKRVGFRTSFRPRA
jgi:hypothetical protein